MGMCMVGGKYSLGEFILVQKVQFPLILLNATSNCFFDNV